MTALADRIATVRQRVVDAMRRRGPGPNVDIVAVSKRQPTEAILEAFGAGVFDLGENYAQELRDKRAAMAGAPARWHFIGPVQTNKVKYVLGSTLVHTVDRAPLLSALDERAARDGINQDVLVQVNVASDPDKHGVPPGELAALLDRFADCTRVRCRGLMLIPPLGDPEATRPHFAALRHLRNDMAARRRPGVDLAVLSMGMSADFEVAIEEGATLVRIGTAVFGPRPA